MEDRAKKIKAIKTLVIYVGIIFAACSTFLSVLGINHESGFPEGGGNLLYLICPMIFALTLAVRGYARRTYEADELISAEKLKGSIPLMLGGLVCAGAFMLSAIDAFRQRGYAYTKLDAMLLTVLGLTAAASAVVMFVSALSEFAEGDTSKVAYLRIVVIAYLAIYTLYIFKGYTIILSIPLQILHIFALVCMLVFLLESAKAYAGIGGASKNLTATSLAWIAMLVYVVTEFTLLALKDSVFSLEFTTGFIVEIALLIYITVFALKEPNCVAEMVEEQPEETEETVEIEKTEETVDEITEE